MVERAIAAIARGLVELGVRQLVVAGGETSGACVQALGVAPVADRPADRSGRALVLGPRRRGPPSAPGAEVGQFRRRRFLQQGLHAAAMNESPGPRGDLPRRQEPVRPRLGARDGRQHQRAAGRRLPDHAHRRLPGLSRSGGAGAGGRAGPAAIRRAGQQDAGAASRPSTRAALRFDPDTRCVIHTHSTHCVALSLRCTERRAAAADHALLRDEGRPCAADRATSGPARRRRPRRWRS